MENRIRIGVSACLLGQPVRFDGSHKHDRYLTGTLGEYLEFVPVCPEVEAGFPIPRETFRLVGDPENPRFVTTRTQVDHTERMAGWAEKRVRELEKENLCGFIFKSDSPSSGLERVKVYNDKGMAEKKASACLPGRSRGTSPCCRWKRKAVSTTPSSGRPSSSRFSP
jgi:uncharacterized protein YbbK (DUF523 family)